MLVKLNPGQPFWMLFDDLGDQPLYRLSFQEPGPIEIDLDSLSEPNQERVKNSLFYRIISEVSPEEAKRPREEQEPIRVNHLIENNPAMQAEQILQGNVKAVKAALDDLVKESKLSVIMAMRALETRGQNQSGTPRSTVLSYIDQASNKCAGLTEITESEHEQVDLVMGDVPEEASNDGDHQEDSG